MLWKIKIRGLITYLIYNIILLIISYFLNRFLPMLTFILFFGFMQDCFKYRFHSDTIIKNPIKAVKYCKLITIAVELIYMAFCKDLDVTLYSNLFIIFIVAFTNCLLEFCLEHFIVKESYLKDKNILIELCVKAKLTENAVDRMIMKYVENKTYEEIAIIECVDVETIKKSIHRSRNKIFKNRD